MGLTSLLPLIILFAVVGGAAYFGYQIYLWSNELADRGQKHMEKKNMTFTKDGGLKVGVKEMGAEEYADRTQRYVSCFRTRTPWKWHTYNRLSYQELRLEYNS